VRTKVVRVDVETETDGNLLVRWELEGGPAAVDVATGPTPDWIDHQHHLAVPASQTELRLERSASRRTFVSVSPHGGGPALVSADRRIAFEGISNFRDLGGYRTRNGRLVRWGQVFRADALHGMSRGDLALYRELGMRTVYDLRTDVERSERPNPVPSRALTIVGRSADEIPPPPPPTATSAAGENFLFELYAGLIEHAAEQIGELFTGLTEEDGLPAVFHCHAGKDRTGLVAALLLEALGVERETILDDYELTRRYRRRTDQEPTFQRLIEYGMSPEAAAGVLGTPRWAMQKALEELDVVYGGVDEYLLTTAGMKAAALDRLSGRLTEA
jgi:protein-tyrosine phosphatase